MNKKRWRAVLRFLAFLSTLASSAIGIMFLACAPGIPPGLRFLFLIPILSAPVLVGLLAWRPARAKVRENRMALRENSPAAPALRGGPVEEGRTIVLIKQKRSRRY